MTKANPSFLLVEDDEVDVRLAKRCMSKAGYTEEIYHAFDGVDALEKLRSGNIPKPYIILMDINMPRMDGMELLRELRSDPELQSSIVFMFTTSTRPEDVKEAYSKNVSGFFVKSAELDDITNRMRFLLDFAEQVELPA